jgi:hypothetical protein
MSSISRPHAIALIHPKTPIHDDNVNASVPASAPNPPACGLADLPFELLCLILEFLRPEPYEQRKGDIDYRIKAYIRALRKFAKLRLTCSLLNCTITPILYRKIAIHHSTRGSLERIAALFEAAAPYVKSVIILDDSSRYREETAVVIGRGLGLCSSFQNLECYGIHCTFSSHWLAKMAPNLKSSISTFVICPGQDRGLSHSLVCLGPSLRRLKIVDWRWRPRGFPFYLPSEMPNLTELTLYGGAPGVKDVVKLVARAIKKHTPARERVCLRSLSLIHVNISEPDVMTILSTNNLCSQLTTLCLHFQLYGSEPGFDFATSVVKICPQLVIFSYSYFADSEVLNHLPHTLAHLELVIVPRRPQNMPPIISTQDFITFLESRRCPALRTSVIIKYPLDTSIKWPDEPRLRSACHQCGVAVQFHREKRPRSTQDSYLLDIERASRYTIDL